MAIWVISTLALLWFGYDNLFTSFCVYICSVFLIIYLRMEYLGHRNIPSLNFWVTAMLFPKWWHQFTFPKVTHEISKFFTFLSIFIFCDYNCLSGCEVMVYDGFDLHFLMLNNIENFYVLNDYLYIFIRCGKFSTIISPNIFLSFSFFILLSLLYVCWCSIFLWGFVYFLKIFSLCSLVCIISMSFSSNSLSISFAILNLLCLLVMVLLNSRISIWSFSHYLHLFIVILYLMRHCHHTFLYLFMFSFISFNTFVIFFYMFVC